MQLVRHAGLAAARRQAADGSSTAAATSEQQQQDSAATSTSTSWPHSDAARTCIARLSYSAVSYHWRGLGQPDWHAVLSGTEAALVEAVAALAVTLERLAAAARTAAEAILGSTAAAAAASGPMALQLLRKLSQRGVLSRHPAGDALREECEAALGACVFGSAAVAAVQLAGLLVELQVGSGCGRAVMWAGAPTGRRLRWGGSWKEESTVGQDTWAPAVLEWTDSCNGPPSTPCLQQD